VSGEDLGFLLRLLVAAVLSGAVGWERERAGKLAGLRTHIVVGVASALYVCVSQVAAVGLRGPPGSIRVEPLQAIQAIAVGIGFLGAGVIREGSGERGGTGLTTAATIWGTAALGIAAALEHYVLAVGAAALFLVVLHGLERFEGAHGGASPPAKR
jgi:putative Mg2+ transporter-C (MgtC) family protein